MHIHTYILTKKKPDEAVIKGHKKMAKTEPWAWSQSHPRQEQVPLWILQACYTTLVSDQESHSAGVLCFSSLPGMGLWALSDSVRPFIYMRANIQVWLEPSVTRVYRWRMNRNPLKIILTMVGVGENFWNISMRTRTVAEFLLLELLKWVALLKDNPNRHSGDYASNANIISTTLAWTQTRALKT